MLNTLKNKQNRGIKFKFFIRTMRTGTRRTTGLLRPRKIFVRSSRSAFRPNPTDMLEHSSSSGDIDGFGFPIDNPVQYGQFEPTDLSGTLSTIEEMVFSPMRSPLTQVASLHDVPNTPHVEEMVLLEDKVHSFDEMVSIMWKAGYVENTPISFSPEQFLEFQTKISESSGIVVVNIVNPNPSPCSASVDPEVLEALTLSKEALKQAASAEKLAQSSLDTFVRWADSQSGLLFFSKSIVALTVSQKACELIDKSNILGTLASFFTG
tara:strand:- start:753 stop:1547 length:795 start_codon:yes stop_codon:yes gene_type:complete